MPPFTLPLTPAASTDIAAQDKAGQPVLESMIALPPPAIQVPVDKHSNGSARTRRTSTETTTGTTKHARDHTTETMVTATTTAFDLPSPPSRPRKIIQMKPKSKAIPQPQLEAPSKRRKVASSKSAETACLTNPTQANTTTAKTTKKATRKTAHSLIERRRRSKMNEAFSTLKEMIPACRVNDDKCTGATKGDGLTRDMHKLDILNAGIEYMTYLQDCLARVGGSEAGKHVPREQVGEKTREGEDAELEEEIKPTLSMSLPLSPPPSLQPLPQSRGSCLFPSSALSSSSSSSIASAGTSPTFKLDHHDDHEDDQNDAAGGTHPDPEAAATARTAAALMMLTSSDVRMPKRKRQGSLTLPPPASSPRIQQPSHHVSLNPLDRPRRESFHHIFDSRISTHPRQQLHDHRRATDEHYFPDSTTTAVSYAYPQHHHHHHHHLHISTLPNPLDIKPPSSRSPPTPHPNTNPSPRPSGLSVRDLLLN
jgi:hypothetical protein